MNPRRSSLAVCLLACMLALSVVIPSFAQDGRETDPAPSLASALAAACRANETQFENYLTADNAAAFRALPAEQRSSVLKRFALNEQTGRSLLSSDDHNHTVLRCTAPEGTAEFRFGDARTRENLAFVPVSVNNGETTQFGMVRENGGWRLISLGLVLLDIPQLSKQWAVADLAAREDAALSDLRSLNDAIQTYRRAFGKLPDSLAQLGPAPKNQVSPDQADLVNNRLAGGSDALYRFRYRIVPGAQEDQTSFELSAVPEDYGKSGRRSFFVDAIGKIHGADKHGEFASADDPAIP